MLQRKRKPISNPLASQHKKNKKKMSASNFTLTQHTVPGQHIRHYARGTATSQEAVLRLSVNQYTPKDAGQPQPGDVTILACHASGFPKELYEPVWDAMLEHTRRFSAFRIRNIWIADVSNQNASGILNEDLIGNERKFFCFYFLYVF